MKEIKLVLNSKSYKITLEDDFVPFFESEFKRFFEDNKLLDTEDLIYAFVQLVYDKFKSENLQKEMIDTIKDSI
ncbi:MAG: hypothetical protein LBG67_04005 [Campylobacteraceae bacterium]|jgi:hypothetical protein|nr:hypothetical protein [Campylobacteraceae bacterium]